MKLEDLFEDAKKTKTKGPDNRFDTLRRTFASDIKPANLPAVRKVDEPKKTGSLTAPSRGGEVVQKKDRAADSIDKIIDKASNAEVNRRILLKGASLLPRMFSVFRTVKAFQSAVETLPTAPTDWDVKKIFCQS